MSKEVKEWEPKAGCKGCKEAQRIFEVNTRIAMSSHGITINKLRDLHAVIGQQVQELDRLQSVIKEAYEVYAGSQRFIAQTEFEAYQQHLIMQMVEILRRGIGGVK